MVIKKCNNGENSIDWMKSLIVIGVFGGIILWAVQVAVGADKKADIALTKIDMLTNQVQHMDAKLDKIAERK